MASIKKPTVKSVFETEMSKKLPPSLEKFDKTDPICLFCNKKQSIQDLWEHTLNCTEYEKALSQPTCPLCKVTVKDAMTLHLYNCEVSSKYFQQMMQYQNSKFYNLGSNLLPNIIKVWTYREYLKEKNAHFNLNSNYPSKYR